MDETIDVEATTIDPPALLSEADKWLAAAAAKVAARCELYNPPAKIETEDQYKDAKAARAQCRRDVSELDSDRKAMTRRLEDALKEFRADVKDVLTPLTDIDGQYKRAIDGYEEQWRVRRHIGLSQEYAELAPNLVALVPFGRVLERFGSERGHAWLNRSTNIVAAQAELADAVEWIANGEAAIDSMALTDDERAEVKAMYFKTLDLQKAMQSAQEMRERRERVAELERSRMAQPEVEPEPEPAPAPAPAQTPNPQPVLESPWVISIPSATREQALMVADFMRANGIVFDRIYAGTVADAYRKEAGNA